MGSTTTTLLGRRAPGSRPVNGMGRSALQRLRTASENFSRFLSLLIQASAGRPRPEESARERVRAAERVRNAMYLTKFGPFTGPASDAVLAKELADGHTRPQTGTPRT